MAGPTIRAELKPAELSICSSGYRSSVAASVLARRGHTMVVNVLGGMMAWTHAGFPIVKGK